LFNVGIRAPSSSIIGTDLPLARAVSYTMFPNSDVDDVVWTLVAMQYGQVMTHDMGLIDGTTQSSTYCTSCYVPKLHALVRWWQFRECLDNLSFHNRLIVESHNTRCCTFDGQIAPDLTTLPRCFPILIPENDPVYSGTSVQCLNFVRSTTDLDRGCSSPYKSYTAEQVSHLHFVHLFISFIPTQHTLS